MALIKDLILVIAILVGAGYSLEKIHNKIRFMALQKVARGLPSITSFTSNLTGISPKRIEQGYLD